MSLKVMTVVGTRPEIIKMSRVFSQLDLYTHHVLVHTGQNFDYELNEIFFRDLEVRKPDYFLNAAGKTTAQTYALVIEKIDDVLEKEQPQALLVYGDTNSCLAVLPAKRRKIPIFHLEAGNRCFDLRVPEEINRKIVDHLSDLNMVHSEHARRYLLQEGLDPTTVIKTGSPMLEILNYYEKQIETSDILQRLKLQPKHYFVVSFHREENVDSEVHLRLFVESLNKIAKCYEKKLIVSVHPRTRKQMERYPDLQFHSLVETMKPLGFFDYIQLQKQAFCVLSDSGTITEESSFLGIPAIMLRQSHERPEGMDAGTVVMSSLSFDVLKRNIDVVVRHKNDKQPYQRDIPDYQTSLFSRQVLRIILSYVDYINRNVWFKNE